MPFILLKLLGFGRMLKNALGAVLSAVRAHPKEAGLIALALACAWLWQGWNGAVADHKADNLAHQQEIEGFKAASIAAQQAALAQVKAVEAKSAQIAKDADNAHTIALADARTAADRYARRMRLDQVCRSNTTAPAEDQPSPRDNGPGEGSELVAITREDFDRATENALRLQAVNAWGETLIEAGLARRELPEVGF